MDGACTNLSNPRQHQLTEAERSQQFTTFLAEKGDELIDELLWKEPDRAKRKRMRKRFKQMRAKLTKVTEPRRRMEILVEYKEFWVKKEPSPILRI